MSDAGGEVNKAALANLKTGFKLAIALGAGLLLASCFSSGSSDAALQRYVEAGDTNRLARYLVSRSNANRVVSHGKPGGFAGLLHMAADARQIDVARLLLSAKADPNLRDSDGRGPLMWVIANDGENDTDRQMVTMLAAAGANPNLQDRHGETALIWASSFGDTALARQLLDAGARVNIANGNGHTALHLAKSAETARILLDAGANINATARNGETPIATAIRRKKFDVVNLLTNALARVDHQ